MEDLDDGRGNLCGLVKARGAGLAVDVDFPSFDRDRSRIGCRSAGLTDVNGHMHSTFRRLGYGGDRE